MRSISESLRAGMTGATITDVGTPASVSWRKASSRRGGGAGGGPHPPRGLGGEGGAAQGAWTGLVFAAAIGIDRAVEGDVGRIVAGDDLAGRIDRDRGLERRQLLEALPAVVEARPCQRLVTARGIRLRPAAATALIFDGHLAVGRR